MAVAPEELLNKIAQFLVFRHYVVCPHCSVPNVLGDDDRDPGGGATVCWSCRLEFRYGPEDVREYEPRP